MTSQGKWEASLPVWGMKAQLPLQNLKTYLTDLPLYIEVCIFRIRFNLNEIFASDALAEMRLNKLK